MSFFIQTYCKMHVSKSNIWSALRKFNKEHQTLEYYLNTIVSVLVIYIALGFQIWFKLSLFPVISESFLWEFFFDFLVFGFCSLLSLNMCVDYTNTILGLLAFLSVSATIHQTHLFTQKLVSPNDFTKATGSVPKHLWACTARSVFLDYYHFLILLQFLWNLFFALCHVFLGTPHVPAFASIVSIIRAMLSMLTKALVDAIWPLLPMRAMVPAAQNSSMFLWITLQASTTYILCFQTSYDWQFW